MFLHVEWNLCYNTDIYALIYTKAFKYIHQFLGFLMVLSMPLMIGNVKTCRTEYNIM
jgi:hypothetical protein